MLKLMAVLLCGAVAVPAAATEQPRSEMLQAESGTFVIQNGQSGREATIKVPVGAVSSFTANAAEALVGYADPKVEAMRLWGDVLINVKGTHQPIQIKADNVVLELTADETPAETRTAMQSSRSAHLLRSAEIIVGGDDTQTHFAGDVTFTVETPAGAMLIKVDRVEHKRALPGA
jgi:hypothetical protein